MAKIAPVKLQFLSFNVMPRRVKSRHGKNYIELAAVLTPHFHLPHAEIIASVKHHKPHFDYSGDLKKFMKEIAISKDSFVPLENYLTKQMLLAMKKPEVAIEIIDAYLKNGVTPDFSVTFVA